MENQEFSVRPAVERTPFQGKPTQAFFSKWCEVNDSIEPKYVSRENYEKQKEKGALQKQADGKKSTLFIPEDLKIWEMVGVIEEVDKDTFSHDPSRVQNKREEFGELGDMFVNAAIYVAKRRGQIAGGGEVAEQVAKDFYRYGNALRTGNYDEQTDIQEIADNSLSPRQTEKIDEWFGVSKDLENVAYPHKSKDMDVREYMRQNMLKQFFKATEKAKEGSVPHQKALEKVHQKYLEKPINKPEQELDSAIFRRGLEKMVNEMGKEGWRDAVVENFKTIGIDLEGQEKNLREALEIPKLKQELADIRATGDVAKISDKEREIAFKIQEAVSRIRYEDGKEGHAFPSKIVGDQARNCVGATMIGGGLLKDVGISYLVGTIPGHSITLLITSDEKIYWQDFMLSQYNGELTNNDIQGVEGKSVVVKNIFEYAHGSSVEPLSVNVLADKYKKFFGGREESSRRISLLSPGLGVQSQVLEHVEEELEHIGDYPSAMVAVRKNIDINPTIPNMYAKLGFLLAQEGEYEGAVEVFKKGLALNWNNDLVLDQASRNPQVFKLLKKELEKTPIVAAKFYREWGRSLFGVAFRYHEDTRNAFYKKACVAYKSALALDSDSQENQEVYAALGKIMTTLNNNKEAVKAYRKYITFLDKEKDQLYINFAKEEIQKLTELESSQSVT